MENKTYKVDKTRWDEPDLRKTDTQYNFEITDGIRTVTYTTFYNEAYEGIRCVLNKLGYSEKLGEELFVEENLMEEHDG